MSSWSSLISVLRDMSGRKKWTSEEIKALEDECLYFLDRKQMPSKKEITTVQDRCSHLMGISWLLIKNKIRNMIQK